MSSQTTLIIPIYNGAQYLPATFLELANFLRGREGEWDVIFVNDGSTDGTAAILDDLVRQTALSARVISIPKNTGKGYAIRQGLSSARPISEYIAYTDVELPYGLKDIETAVRLLADQGDMVIGTRTLASTPQYSWYRKICTRLFHLLLPSAARRVTDTQSGLKAFRRAAAEDIFSRVRTNRWVFDIEVFLAAAHAGYKLREISVSIKPSCVTPKGGVSLRRHGLLILLDLVKIHWGEYRGIYKNSKHQIPNFKQ